MKNKSSEQYALFQNGRHYSVLLFSFKFPLVASFLSLKSKEYYPLNEATRTDLQANERTLKWRSFWNKMYVTNNIIALTEQKCHHPTEGECEIQLRTCKSLVLLYSMERDSQYVKDIDLLANAM